MADVRVFGMGRNNRQRRSAKQKARARRGPTPARHRSPESELIDDLWDEFDGLDEDGFIHHREEPAVSPQRGQQAPRTVPTTGQQARDVLDRLLRWAGAELSADGLTSMMSHELSGQPSEVLLRVEELTSRALLQAAGPLWERGWQPRDLIHVAGRLDRWTAALAADLSVTHLQRLGHLELAPPSWQEQLEAARDQAQAAGITPWAAEPEPLIPGEPESEWAAVGQLLVAGAAALTAWTSAIRLLARMQRLPSLAPTLPPPSAWGPAAERPPRRTARSAQPTRPGTPAASGANRDKVLTTIRALLAKAESTQFAAEAEALTAKAQSMMTRHAIDEALLQAGAEDSVEVISRRILLDNPYLVEKVHLLSAVGHANRSKVVWMGDFAMATVVGTPVDVDQVELLFVSLLIQATRAMAEAGTERAGSFDRSPRFRRSFLTSYAVRIGERLTEADAEAAASNGSELVPVLRRQEEAVSARYEELFPDTTQMNSRKTYDRRGWDAGRRAADRARFVQGRIAG